MVIGVNKYYRESVELEKLSCVIPPRARKFQWGAPPPYLSNIVKFPIRNVNSITYINVTISDLLWRNKYARNLRS